MSEQAPINKVPTESKKVESERDANKHIEAAFLESMDVNRRSEIITTSHELTRDIPGAMIMGGNALRLIYEAKTGKRMFGAGKNDYDIYVPSQKIVEYIDNPPEGYTLKEELDENGNQRWIDRDSAYVVLTSPSGEHVDVFGRADGRESEIITIDGKEIRVESLTDQIKDMLVLGVQTDGFSSMSDKSRDKYGVYAQMLREITDSASEDIDESRLPENWREALLVLCSQGRWGEGKQVDQETLEYRERLRKENETLESIKREKQMLIDDLLKFYETYSGGDSPELTGAIAEYFSEHEQLLVSSLAKSENSTSFINEIVSGLSSEDKDKIDYQIEEKIR